jgi:hypothetical protein
VLTFMSAAQCGDGQVPLAVSTIAKYGIPLLSSEGASNLKSFMTGIRYWLGRPSKFAEEEKFDSNEIQKALLQFLSVNAYQLERLNTAITDLNKEIHSMNQILARLEKAEANSDTIQICASIGALLALLMIFGYNVKTRSSNSNSNTNINVNKNKDEA